LNTRELLQNVQEAYASLINLPMTIIRSVDTTITSFSNVTDFAKLVVFSNHKRIRDEWETYSQLKNPAVIDSHLQGVKVIIAPVLVAGQTDCLIWAGPFIEKGKKQLVEEQLCKDNGNKGDLTNAVEEAQELSIVEIEEKINYIQKMSYICTQLIENQKRESKQSDYIRLLKSAVGNIVNGHLQFEEFLNLLQRLDEHIDFVIHAQRQREKQFIVRNVAGKIDAEAWGGELLDRPLVRRLLEEKQPLYLEDLSLQLDLADFINKGIKPTALYVYPLMQNGEITDIILIGSEVKKQFSSQLKEVGNIITQTIAVSFKHKWFESLIDKHLMRVSTLIEISKAMSMANNIDEIFKIMADLAIDLIHGDFSAIIVNNHQHNIITNTGLVLTPSVREYCEQIAKYYLNREMANFSTSPRLTETNVGTVMEYPFYVDGDTRSVLAVHIQDSTAIKEAEVYLSAIITIASLILRQAVQNREETIDEFLMSPEIRDKFLAESLTAREKDVLKYLVQGYSNREIAEKLYISVHTVKNHITNIFQKLGVTDRSQVIAMVYKFNYAKFEL